MVSLSFPIPQDEKSLLSATSATCKFPFQTRAVVLQ